jgi:hypothetical protein
MVLTRGTPDFHAYTRVTWAVDLRFQHVCRMIRGVNSQHNMHVTYFAFGSNQPDAMAGPAWTSVSACTALAA